MTCCEKCKTRLNLSHSVIGFVKLQHQQCRTCNTTKIVPSLIGVFDPYGTVDEVERLQALYVSQRGINVKAALQFLEKLHADYRKSQVVKRVRVGRLDLFEQQFMKEACAGF